MSDAPLGPARTPEAVHAVLEDAFNRGDLDAYTSAFEEDASLVAPPDGSIVHGRDDIRAASAPIFALTPRARIEVRHTLEVGGLALTQARWHLADRDGQPVEPTMSTATSARAREGSPRWRSAPSSLHVAASVAMIGR
jgi:uncharacterized protein (TIGR02246 family)